jgi:hypothetical protein
MCSINHELKVIFIHTPKCGGLYVEKLLEKYYNFKTYYFTHENHNEYFTCNNDKNRENIEKDKNLNGFLKITKGGVLRYFSSSKIHNDFTNMTKEHWDTYKKIAVIRNPYDRVVSSYLYIKNKLHLDISLSEFIQKKDIIDQYSYFHTFINQYDNLLDLNNELHIDYYVKFENLNSDLCDTLLSIGIKKILHREQILNNTKINKSSNDNYYKYYDDEIIKQVNNYFLNDLKYFHYSQINSFNELKEDSKKYYLTEDQFSKKNIQLLIKLDKTDSIIQLEDLDKIIGKSIKTVFNNQHYLVDNSNNLNIQLDNGLNIEVDNINDKTIVENNNPYTPELISNGFMKALEKLVIKYGGKKTDN